MSSSNIGSTSRSTYDSAMSGLGKIGSSIYHAPGKIGSSIYHAPGKLSKLLFGVRVTPVTGICNLMGKMFFSYKKEQEITPPQSPDANSIKSTSLPSLVSVVPTEAETTAAKEILKTEGKELPPNASPDQRSTFNAEIHKKIIEQRIHTPIAHSQSLEQQGKTLEEIDKNTLEELTSAYHKCDDAIKRNNINSIIANINSQLSILESSLNNNTEIKQLISTTKELLQKHKEKLANLNTDELQKYLYELNVVFEELEEVTKRNNIDSAIANINSQLSSLESSSNNNEETQKLISTTKELLQKHEGKLAYLNTEALQKYLHELNVVFKKLEKVTPKSKTVKLADLDTEKPRKEKLKTSLKSFDPKAILTEEKIAAINKFIKEDKSPSPDEIYEQCLQTRIETLTNREENLRKDGNILNPEDQKTLNNSILMLESLLRKKIETLTKRKENLQKDGNILNPEDQKTLDNSILKLESLLTQKINFLENKSTLNRNNFSQQDQETLNNSILMLESLLRKKIETLTKREKNLQKDGNILNQEDQETLNNSILKLKSLTEPLTDIESGTQITQEYFKQQ